MSDGIISVHSLYFGYGREPILCDVNMDVARGDFAAIIGANGVGKSTLIKLILGELKQNSGTIKLFGAENEDFNEMSKLGYVPQSGFRFNSHFPATAFEVVYSNLYPKLRRFRLPRPDQVEEAMHALQMVNLEDQSRKLIGELSGGQLQRVLLARALVGSPELIILDEPTAGVDTASTLAFNELLLKLNRKLGITIVVITHDLASISEYINRTFCLEQGYLLELSAEEIKHELSHRHQHPPLQKGDK